MPRLRTTVDKALHQVWRGRRKVTARQFNQAVRDLTRVCDCVARRPVTENRRGLL